MVCNRDRYMHHHQIATHFLAFLVIDSCKGPCETIVLSRVSADTKTQLGAKHKNLSVQICDPNDMSAGLHSADTSTHSHSLFTI